MAEQEFNVPVLRNGEDIKENLTDNALNNILPARYTKKNADGKSVEEPYEVFDRVAKNLAIPDLMHSVDYLEINHSVIKTDHPRRDELIDEVFNRNGDKISSKVELTEENAKYVEYDALQNYLMSEELSEYVNTLEKSYLEFKRLMEQLKFVPNSPTLMNAGDELQQLSACFVISPEDDIDEIHHTVREAADVFQSGGGMGYGFWTLRPKGEPVGSTGGFASGPISFMHTFDQMCETIAQGGMRRGAQMGVMSVDHPDVIEFIHAKRKDVSLAHTLRLNDPDDFTHTSFAEALDEARELIDNEGRVPEHLRNAVEGHLSNFNISVGVTDDFMQALQNGEDFTFRHPDTKEPFIANHKTVEMYEMFDLGEYVEEGETLTIPSEVLWERMIEGAHENGEPGVVFIDRFNKKHSFPVDTDEPLQDQKHAQLATNPCGEQPLQEYEACNLGHINLSTIVDEDVEPWINYEQTGDLQEDVRQFLGQAIDWNEFDHRIKLGTRFLDNVVTMSDFPVDKITETVRDNRKIGLGIMGLAQMFIEIGVEYGSDVGNEVSRQIMTYINHESKKVSSILAENRGNFNTWGESKYANPTEYREWFEHHTGEKASNWEDGYPMRNHNTTTVAPTGTTSMIGNTSGGCEPIYNVARYKNVSDDVQGDEMLVEFDELFLKTLELNDIDVREVKEEAQELMQNNEFDGPQDLSIPDEIANLFVTTGDLTALEHGSVQCAIQEGVDSAISKTVNAPNDASLEDAKEAFEYVYENGGKGVTYYRDGTRTKQVLTTRKDNQDVDDEDGDGKEREVPFHREAPDVIEDVQRHRIQTARGKMYVTIGEDEHGIVEVMATVGKSGGLIESMCEALARQVSQSFQWGVPVEEVISQLENIRSQDVAWDDGDTVSSIPDGIALALKRYIGNNEDAPEGLDIEQENVEGSDEPCPDCGSTNTYKSEGCITCQECGWSKCS